MIANDNSEVSGFNKDKYPSFREPADMEQIDTANGVYPALKQHVLALNKDCAQDVCLTHVMWART